MEDDDKAPTASSAGHPTNGLSDVVHQRHRLGILTIAAESERVEVAYLRDTLELTAGNLSRHLAVLEEAGLIQIERGYHGRRPKTWIRITRQGQEALAAEIAALQQLLRGHQHSHPRG
ncbi:transcriptional regulator [Micromonospora sp. NPDC048909]|uniref:transcriptional regulator n=1 Tax=Micromonospora sp. NPDC048909 TaxID=3155643 RepID=UPI0033E8E78D